MIPASQVMTYVMCAGILMLFIGFFLGFWMGRLS